jgi:DNA polymerase I
LALRGDSVDNIPGIDGVGSKTAVSLIREFGTVERLLEGLDRIPNAKLREKIAANREQILQNRQMVTLELDHDLPVPLRELKIAPRYPEFLELLEKCEFRSLITEVQAEATQASGGQQELF